MNKRLIVAVTVISTLGITGVARVFAGSKPQRPVALLPQRAGPPTAVFAMGRDQGKPLVAYPVAQASDPLNNANTEARGVQVPLALIAIGECGERVYDTAKTADWPRAQADLAALQQAAHQLSQQVPSNGSGIRQLTASLDRLSQAVASKGQLTTEQEANRVTLLAAQMGQQYPTKVPIEVTLLDYYGRQLEIEAADGNWVQLEKTARKIEQTWHGVRPAIVARGGTSAAQPFDKLITKTQQASSNDQLGQLAASILHQVDQLEAVFK